MNSVFEHADVVITPVAAGAPPLIADVAGRGVARSLRLSNATAWTAPWNAIGQPAASVPVGCDSNGLPLAVRCEPENRFWRSWASLYGIHDRQNGGMADARTRPSQIALVTALVGAVFLVVSAFLVWGTLDIKIGTISEKGTDSAAGVAVIVLGVGILALLVGWFAGLPPTFVRVGWAFFGVAAVGLGIYALIQVNSAPADFFSNVTGALKDSGIGGALGELGIDQGDLSNAAAGIVGVDYGPGIFLAIAGGVATVIAALLAGRGRGAEG
jgi:hypothetical protein